MSLPPSATIYSLTADFARGHDSERLFMLCFPTIAFSEVFMTGVPALSLASGEDYWFVSLDRSSEPGHSAFAAAITALAVPQKLTVIFGIPMFYLFWPVKGLDCSRRAEIDGFVALVVIRPVAWYVHANAMSRQSGFAFVQPGLFG